MLLDDLHSEFAEAIDLTNSRLDHFPSRVFLCGGVISSSYDDRGSVRHLFWHFLKAKASPLIQHIVLAEDTIKLFQAASDSYNDLLTFEKDLAHLSSLTVIFLESPGSIAELGSFSVLKEINEKLIIVIRDEHTDNNSFIWHGPIKYLKNLKTQHGEPIYAYSWTSDHNGFVEKKEFEDYAKDIENALSHILSKIPGSVAFSINEPGHLILLIADLIQIIHIATFTDIKNYFINLHLSIEDKILYRYLELLAVTKFIGKVKYGANQFYTKGTQQNYVSFSFNKVTRTNRADRWESIFKAYYLENREDRRSKALHSYWKKISQKGDVRG